MLENNFPKQFSSIHVSNVAVTHQIADVSENIQQQRFQKLRDKFFLIQLDEETDSNRHNHIIVHLRFCEGMPAVEDQLFCRPVKLKATAVALFYILNNFINEVRGEKKLSESAQMELV